MSGSLTSLVVDDSSVARRFARGILEELHFDVREAEDGSVALARCQESLPDLILLDWNMPVMNGMEFMQAVRRLPGADQVRIVFCTTRTELPSVAQALAGGADEYLMKPYDREALESKLVQIGLLP